MGIENAETTEVIPEVEPNNVSDPTENLLETVFAPYGREGDETGEVESGGEPRGKTTKESEDADTEEVVLDEEKIKVPRSVAARLKAQEAELERLRERPETEEENEDEEPEALAAKSAKATAGERKYPSPEVLKSVDADLLKIIDEKNGEGLADALIAFADARFDENIERVLAKFERRILKDHLEPVTSVLEEELGQSRFTRMLTRETATFAEDHDIDPEKLGPIENLDELTREIADGHKRAPTRADMLEAMVITLAKGKPSGKTGVNGKNGNAPQRKIAPQNGRFRSESPGQLTPSIRDTPLEMTPGHKPSGLNF